MTTHLMFDFTDQRFSQSFTMSKPCSNNPVNPSNQSNHVIYIIENTNHNPPTSYVGYTRDPRERWTSRTEVCAHLGLSQPYGKAIKCAWCKPRISIQGVANPNVNNVADWQNVPANDLKGQDCAEHLLIRAMIQGVMGIVVCTNTQLVNMQFRKQTKFPNLITVYIYCENGKFNWPGRNNNVLNNLPPNY